MKITRNQRKEEKKNKKTKRREDKRKTTFEPAAPVGGTSIISIVMFYLESAWCLATLSAFCFLISSTAVCPPPPHSARSVNNRHAPSAIFPAPWRCALSNVLFPPPPYRQASHLLLQACHSCLFRQPLLRLDIQRR